MRFLSLADRELRAAARRKVTYRTRWITAVVFFGLLLWLLWALNGFTSQTAGPEIFRVYSVLTFLYCLFVGTALTADCISSERREGTLGLLFLTNMNSLEIVAGKLCSMALPSLYAMMAIIPMLALPLLMGGITFATFTRAVVGLLNGILFALATGLLSSVVCKRQFTAITLALGITFSLAGGLMLAAAAANSFGPTRPLAPWLAVFCPLYTVISADGARTFGSNFFWQSAATVAGLSLAGLGLATLLLSRTWRDQAKGARARPWFKFWQRSERRRSRMRDALRHRLLAINPQFWLGARQRLSAPIFMCIAVILSAVTVYVAAPFFERVMGGGSAGPVLGYLFAWFWAGLAIHALVLYYAAMSASQRLAEDKQTRALELVLCTPTTEKTISQGLWLAYGRKMLFPALLAVLVHVFFIWTCLVMLTLDPPGGTPSGATPGQLFWSALFNRPLKGQQLEWQFGFMLRAALLVLLQLIVTWPTLGWLGRWLGVTMKHPGFAPITSLVLLIVPPVLVFSFACYLADELQFDRIRERMFLPVMMWLGFMIGVGHCLLLSIWAARRFRKNLRSVVMSHYQPLLRRRWRLPSRRTVGRVVIAGAALVLVVASLVLSYYGYQNWRGTQTWKTFQASIKASGETLDLAPLLPEPVPDAANFARSPAFVGLLTSTNRELTSLLDQMKSFGGQLTGPSGNYVLMDWQRQSPAPLNQFANRVQQRPGIPPATARQDDAKAILGAWSTHSGPLQELADASGRFSALQIQTDRDADAVFQHPQRELLAIEGSHLLFQVRACALLELGQNASAADDLLTGLRIARLARQLPDARCTERVQRLLMASLQTLWEGLRQHAWTEPELAGFQRELESFNLLADYTNAVRRVVLAHIEVWSAIPDSSDSDIGLLASSAGYMREPVWQLQPRGWWFDNCIQLHRAGQKLIEQVDTISGRVQGYMNWSDLNGLPLDPESTQLLQHSIWSYGPNPQLIPFAQTALNQASLACALERFHLVHRAYPKVLEELVPVLLDRIPHDAVSGQPIVYQPTEDGSFILRGVGPNGKVDRKNIGSDDWLWAYSTNTPSGIK